MLEKQLCSEEQDENRLKAESVEARVERKLDMAPDAQSRRRPTDSKERVERISGDRTPGLSRMSKP